MTDRPIAPLSWRPSWPRTTSGSRCCPNGATKARARRSARASREATATSSSSRTPTSSTTRPTIRQLWSRSSTAGPTWFRLAVRSAGPHRRPLFWHYVGNRLLTLAVQHVHQPEPHRHGDLLQGLPARGHRRRIELEEDRFGSSPRSPPSGPPALRIYEVGIAYDGRTYAEGKKIGWRDGVRALLCILRYSPIGERLRHSMSR